MASNTVENVEPVDKCGAPVDYYDALAAEVAILRARVANSDVGSSVLDPNLLEFELNPDMVSPGDSFKP